MSIYRPINLPLLTTSLLSIMATFWADHSATAALSATAAALLLLAPSPAPSPANRSSRSRSSLDWALTPIAAPLFVRCFGLVSAPTESACHLVTFRKNAQWGYRRHPCGPAGTLSAAFLACTRQGILTYSFPGSEVVLAKSK